MTYGVCIVYAYINDVTDDFGMKSEIMETDFRPNTPRGIERITHIIRNKFPLFRSINIVNLIPLANDPNDAAKDDTE